MKRDRDTHELFPDEPHPAIARARSTDPASSHIAAREVEKTGGAQRQRDAALRLVKAHPGLTARELAAAALCASLIAEAHQHDALHRRLPELRALGLVANGPMRTCAISRRKAITWLPGSKALP